MVNFYDKKFNSEDFREERGTGQKVAMENNMAPLLPLGPAGEVWKWKTSHSLSRLQGEKASRNSSGLCTVSDMQFKKLFHTTNFILPKGPCMVDMS